MQKRQINYKLVSEFLTHFLILNKAHNNNTGTMKPDLLALALL